VVLCALPLPRTTGNGAFASSSSERGASGGYGRAQPRSRLPPADDSGGYGGYGGYGDYDGGYGGGYGAPERPAVRQSRQSNVAVRRQGQQQGGQDWQHGQQAAASVSQQQATQQQLLLLQQQQQQQYPDDPAFPDDPASALHDAHPRDADVNMAPPPAPRMRLLQRPALPPPGAESETDSETTMGTEEGQSEAGAEHSWQEQSWQEES
jgi:hypothetical protein